MESLAERLAGARISGQVIHPGPGEGPDNQDAAYRLQRQVNALLRPLSDAWKVGSTSAEARRQLGTSEPGAAPVPARYLHPSGDTVRVFPAHDTWIEAEFAFRLGRELPQRDDPWDDGEVANAIDAAAPALELVGSRLASGLSGAGRFWVTADGGANVGLVIGRFRQDWRRYDLPSHPVRLIQNGVEAASGTGSRALGNPLSVMTWIANHRRCEGGLPVGTIVSTGTCTGLLRVAPGDRLRADFGDLGSVEITLAE